MSDARTFTDVMDSVERILEEERRSLLTGSYGELAKINADKASELRNLEMHFGTISRDSIAIEQAKSSLTRIHAKARENSELLGTAMHGARAASRTLRGAGVMEPLNETYTALGKKRALGDGIRHNNLMV